MFELTRLPNLNSLSIAILVATLSITSAQATTDAQQLNHKINHIQLPFVANSGQIDNDSVKFYARTLAGTVFVMDTGKLVYLLPKKTNEHEMSAWAFSESLMANDTSVIEARSPSSAQINYFRGADKQSKLTAFDEISLGQSYDGVEVVIRAYNNNVEKLFIVSPGANPEEIRVAIDGMTGLSIDSNGSLGVETGLGTVSFTAPVAYQDINGKREYVEVAYLVNDNGYSFKLGDWDKKQTLVIDPLVESTFLGGGGQDRVNDIEFSNNEVFITGWTASADFPATLGAVNNFSGGLQDAFIARMSPDLSTLLSASYLGGTAQEWGVDMAIADDGSVYMTGYANSSTGIPTTAGAYLELGAGAYVAKFSNDLGTLHVATYVGFSSSDFAKGISVHGDSVYIAGRTFSASFPTTEGAYDTTCGSDGRCDPSGAFGIPEQDAFISKFNSDLTSLTASTFLGTSSFEGANDIAVDSNGDVYVVGETRSRGFPTTPDSYSPTLPQQSTVPSAFVSKLDSTLSHLLSSSFLNGSDGSNLALAVTLANGSVYIAGGVNDANLPTSIDAYDRTVNGDGFFANGIEGDVFISRMDTNLTTLQAATYYGGNAGDAAEDISATSSGSIVISGRTLSSNLPTTSNAHDQSFNGNRDAFFATFDSNLTTLEYASFLGGAEEDTGLAIATNGADQVYVGGMTNSFGFDTTDGAFDTSNGGNEDGFIALFDVSGGTGDDDPSTNIAPIADAGSDFSAIQRTTVFLDGSASSDSDGNIVSYLWKQVSGKTVKLKNKTSSIAKFRAPRVRKNKSKVLVFELSITDDQGDTSTDTVTVTIIP